MLRIRVRVNTKRHHEITVFDLKPPSPVLGTKGRNLNADLREMMFQVFAQCLSIHPFIYDLIVLSLKDRKFFGFNRNTGMRNHFVTTQSKIRHRIKGMLSTCIVNWGLIIRSA